MLNVYINYGLYIISFFVLLFYFFGKHKDLFSKKYYALILAILLIYLIGLSVGILRGAMLYNPQEFILSDISRSLVFPLILVFVGLTARMKDIKYIENIFVLLSVIFSIVMLLSELFSLNLLGNLVKATTIQRFNLSFIGFFGFYLLANERYKNAGRFVILISWVMAVLSLAKWNFFPAIVFPLLWLGIETRKVNWTKRIAIFLFVIIILSLVFYSFNDELVARQWGTWHEYLRQRIKPGNVSGGRFRMWSDLMQQFSKVPLLGIGFGARPTYINVEDHNIFIFFLVRFGAPLFFLFGLLVMILFIHILYSKSIKKINRLIFLILFFYFFFAASVSTTFGQILNGITISIIAGIIIHPRNNYLHA